MSEHLLKIALAELAKMRIVCKKCSTMMEMAIEHLADVSGATFDPRSIQCPRCGAYLPDAFQAANDKSHPIRKLAAAIQALAIHSGEVGIEFVIPVSDKHA